MYEHIAKADRVKPKHSAENLSQRRCFRILNFATFHQDAPAIFTLRSGILLTTLSEHKTAPPPLSSKSEFQAQSMTQSDGSNARGSAARLQNC